MTQEAKNLLKLFLFVAFIKILISFYMKGPFIFSDEPCVTQIAMHFAKTFKLESCAQITGMLDAGTTTAPLYSVIISPIYWLFSGMKAYYAILILNSILFSSLVFPLHSIFKTFLKKNQVIFLNILVILFMTSVLIYEKILMTEGLFIVINIWLLQFYIKALKEGKFKYKAVAILFALLATISRPFGFIVPLAMALNEFMISKNKKRASLLILPVVIISYMALQRFVPDLSTMLMHKMQSFKDPNNLLLIFKALKNQLNSFTISTLFIGTVMFMQFLKQDEPLIKKMKYFFITLISINFIISAHHIYGYYLANEELHLLTRYINISTIFIYIFALIFLSNNKKIQLRLFDKVFSAILIISFFLIDKNGKFPQNLDLLPLYKIIDIDTATFFYQVNLILIPLFILFLLMAMRNRKILIKQFLIVILLVQTIFSIYCLQNIQKMEYTISSFFLDKSNEKITYIITPQYKELPQFWKIAALTSNKLSYTMFNEKPENGNTNIDADYIITTFDLNLPLVHSHDNIKVYENLKKNVLSGQPI